MQAVVKQSEVQTQVQRVARLPAQVGIGHGGDGTTRVAQVLVAIAHQVDVAVVVGRQGTVDTVRGTQAQVAQYGYILHERFADDTPGASYAPEVTPAGIGAEA